MTYLRAAVLLIVLLVGRALPAAAQVVRGIALDQATSGPIEGAMIVLLDPLGFVAARSLTDSAGAFVARVRQPGAYRARVERIGYESVTTDPFDLGGEVTFQRILVPARPIELAGLDVSGPRRCEVRPEVGRATATLWEEARKALEAAGWTATSGEYDYTLLHFARELDARGRTTLGEERTFLERSGGTPYASMSPEALVEQGWVRAGPLGAPVYSAPDAGTLLSDPFLDTHCLRVGDRNGGSIGLRFEPVKGRDLPDVEGVMWLDERTAELRRVEYSYVHVDRRWATGDAGGVLSFTRLRSGAWIVGKWYIQMPIAQRERGRVRRVRYERKGGVVWSATDAAGTLVHRAITGSVSGRILDSLGAPLPGATVVPRGIPSRAESGARGAFVLKELPEGRVGLELAVPYLDSLGLRTLDGPVWVELAEGGTAHADFRVRGVREELGLACGGKRPSDTAILLGRVRDADGRAIAATVALAYLSGSARFRLNDRATPLGGRGIPPSWQWLSPDLPWFGATLDPRGLFLLCDVPVPSTVRASVEAGDRKVETDIMLESRDAVTVVSVTLPPPDPPARGSR